jgi:hypothetical protein
MKTMTIIFILFLSHCGSKADQANSGSPDPSADAAAAKPWGGQEGHYNPDSEELVIYIDNSKTETGVAAVTRCVDPLPANLQIGSYTCKATGETGKISAGQVTQKCFSDQSQSVDKRNEISLKEPCADLQVFAYELKPELTVTIEKK